MRVRVLFFGPLRDITGTPEEEVCLEGEEAQGASLGRLFDRYAGRHPRLAAMRDAIVLARNQEFGGYSTPLADGDEVAFLPPVSGGTGPSVGTDASAGTGALVDPSSDHFEIVRAPIDTRALAARLLRGEDGAVVTFEGVTRNHSGQRATRFLEYEAYEPMALGQMRAIAREVKERWPVDRVGIIHRLGRLEIGETSVAIVVTAAHRKPAFEACHFAIDRLKKTVPIWKKEHFADGTVWVEGQWDAALIGGR